MYIREVIILTIDVVIFFQEMRNGFFDFFFNFISFLGEDYVYILIFGIVYYAYNKKMGEFMAISLGVSAAVNTIIKNIVGAKRPFEKYPDLVENLRPDTAGGTSFPSGHTQNFSAVLYSGSFFTKNIKVFYVSTVLVLLMMISRMYLGVHFLEDVVVSGILGFGIAYGLYKVFMKYYEDTVRLHRLYLALIIVLLPFAIFINGAYYFKSYGLLIGFIVGIMVEKKYINFTMNVKLMYKVIRVVLGLIVMIGIQQGFKILFGIFAEEGTDLMNVFHMIRYFLIAFTGFGLYPFLFNKFKF